MISTGRSGQAAAAVPVADSNMAMQLPAAKIYFLSLLRICQLLFSRATPRSGIEMKTPGRNAPLIRGLAGPSN
jgi:hypothetical protein